MPLQLERLESREVPAVAVSLSAGVLKLTGGALADTVNIKQISDQIQVTSKSGTEATFTHKFVATSVTRIEFRGGDGNDTLTSDVNKICLAYGDNGNDWLRGGGLNDTINGGAGADSIYGGTGADTLNGDAGNDWLQGDSGADKLNGGADTDRYKDYFSTFINGVDLRDIRQGESGVCTILAALGSTVGTPVKGETWANRVQQVDAATYRVKLYNNGVAYWQNVNFSGSWSDDDAMPTSDASGQTYEAWVIVVQRAVLSNYGVPWATTYSKDWEKYGGKWTTSTRSLPVLTGKTSALYEQLEDYTKDTPKTLQDRLKNNFVVAETEPGTDTFLTGTPIVANHAYTVTKVYQTGTTWNVEIYNPWGSRDTNATNGSLTLTWDQFYATFYGYAY